MRVLHVPYTYAPDAIGGTEVYVSSLAKEQVQLGLDVVVAAPGSACTKAHISGIDVFRFPTGDDPGFAEGAVDRKAANSFAAILDEMRPDVVHVHARTAAVSDLLLKAAKDRGAATVFTYHTPTVSCVRGTMMLNGWERCDGKIEIKRCSACVLRKHQVPSALAASLARVPPVVGRVAEGFGLRKGPWLALRMPHIVNESREHFRAMMAAADRVVAVCDWVADVLRCNGIREPKLLVNRQGIALDEGGISSPAATGSGILRVAYFGRLDPAKGIAVLLEAMRLLPSTPLTLSLYGVTSSSEHADALKRSGLDKRIRVLEPVAASQVVAEMREHDLIAVPSTGLETGPLVVLEAHAAGVPVLGSRLGGIAELVRHGVDGVLVEPNDPDAWAAAMEALARDPARLDVLRSAIRPPRSIANVAADMAGLYQELDANRGTRLE